jgi:molybdopterin converting factor small subunit
LKAGWIGRRLSRLGRERNPQLPLGRGVSLENAWRRVAPNERIKTVKVQIKLFGIFREFCPPRTEGLGFWLDIDDDARIQDLLSRLKIPENLPRSVICNGRVAKEDQVLRESDVVAIFSPITGG